MSAASSATAAAASEQKVHDDALAAESAASAAAASEASALDSKESSSQSEANALSSANSAQQSKVDSESARDSAAASATSASTDAATATQKATDAYNEAERAKGYADSIDVSIFMKKAENLADVGNMEVARSNIGVDRLKQAESETMLYAPGNEPYRITLRPNADWGVWNDDGGGWMALPVAAGGTGATSREQAWQNIKPVNDLVMGRDVGRLPNTGEELVGGEIKSQLTFGASSSQGWLSAFRSYVKGDAYGATEIACTNLRTGQTARYHFTVAGILAEGNHLELGNNRQESGFSYIDFHTQKDDDFGYRIVADSNSITHTVAHNQYYSFSGKYFSFSGGGGIVCDSEIHARSVVAIFPLQGDDNYNSHIHFRNTNGSTRGVVYSTYQGAVYLRPDNYGTPGYGFTFDKSGTFVCSSVQQTSDRRLKDNIVKVSSAVDKVKKLNGYTFNVYPVNGIGGESAGVIAQEVESVMPCAVKVVDVPDSDDNEDGNVYMDNGEKLSSYKTVDYSQLSALYIEAIKEIADIQERHSEEVEALKSDIQDLKDAIKQMMSK